MIKFLPRQRCKQCVPFPPKVPTTDWGIIPINFSLGNQWVYCDYLKNTDEGGMSASPHNATLECLCPVFPWLHRWSRPSSSLCQPIYSNPSLRPCEISAEFTATSGMEWLDMQVKVPWSFHLWGVVNSQQIQLEYVVSGYSWTTKDGGWFFSENSHVHQTSEELLL